MENKLYVGNIPFQTQADDLRNTFAPYGDVTDVFIVTDRETGRSRGFAFVSMAEGAQAEAAAAALNNADFGGRPLIVNIARPMEERAPREGGFRPRSEGGFRPRSEGGFRPRSEGGFRKPMGGGRKFGGPRRGGDEG